MNKSSDWAISMRICRLLSDKLSSAFISDTNCVQHKCKSDHRHNIILYKLWIQCKSISRIKESNNFDRTSQYNDDRDASTA